MFWFAFVCLLANRCFGNVQLFHLATRGDGRKWGRGLCGQAGHSLLFEKQVGACLSSLSLCVCVALKGSRRLSALCKENEGMSMHKLQTPVLGLRRTGDQGYRISVPALPLDPKLTRSLPLSAPLPLAEKWGTGIGEVSEGASEKDRALSSETWFFFFFFDRMSTLG